MPFFKGIADVDFERFNRSCSWRRYGRGEIVLNYEDESSDVYFIISGGVRVLIRTAAGKEVILGDIGAGQFFGEMAAIDHEKRSANVTTLSNSAVCAMPSAVFWELLRSSPTACGKILKVFTERIRELNTRLAEHSIYDLRRRLYSELLRAAQPRLGKPNELAVTPPPLHQFLAARIGCRREQVTREIAALSKQKLVQKTRGALILLQPKLLQMRLNGFLQEPG
ncbi:MAG TPA: Crp/Fnr family transcriptional regulator [Bryobacteraceae bacterium]|nr:Crp/Fnr family transcriptional regulator [Bryobacteraceae bacterium]